MFDELLNSEHMFVDRGEIRCFPDVYNRLGARALKVDIAVREHKSFNDTSLRRQFSIVEAARSDNPEKLGADTIKTILAASNILVALQRTSSQSGATMRKVAIPVFVYSSTPSSPPSNEFRHLLMARKVPPYGCSSSPRPAGM